VLIEKKWTRALTFHCQKVFLLLSHYDCFLGSILSLVCPGGEGEAEAVMVEGVDQPFAVVESAISFIWTLSEYCQLLDQLPLGKEAGWSP
jgi:hypothetical protein